VDLYADGTDQASDDNQKLELAKFKTVAEPFYAILDPDEKVVATFDGLTRDPVAYLAFLEKGATSAVAAPRPAAGGSLPQVTKLDGTPLDTAAWNGKVVVVNFWATWCVPCIGEFPGFNKLQRDFAAKGVVVVGVSIDEEGAARVQPFLKKHPMDYTVALGSEAVQKQFAAENPPVTVIFDRAGKQLKRFEGFTPDATILAAVEQAL